jgi:hypothetical protein
MPSSGVETASMSLDELASCETHPLHAHTVPRVPCLLMPLLTSCKQSPRGTGKGQQPSPCRGCYGSGATQVSAPDAADGTACDPAPASALFRCCHHPSRYGGGLRSRSSVLGSPRAVHTRRHARRSPAARHQPQPVAARSQGPTAGTSPARTPGRTAAGASPAGGGGAAL